MMEFYTDKEIGLIIRRHRQSRNLTQKELGELMGVQKSAVQKWESGMVKNIKRSTLQQLSVILGISPVTLIGIKGED